MKKWLVLCLMICVVLSSACSSTGRTTPVPPAPASTTSAPESTVTPTATATAVPPATTPPHTPTAPPPTPIPIPPGADVGFRQWAIAAVASSEYGDGAYSAMQATGEPDTTCGAAPSAWSPADADGVAWLELSYDSPTVPTLINIIQTHDPSQIVKVELIDYLDNYYEIYAAQPYAFDACPHTLSIPVLDVGYQIRGLRITVDQTALGVGRPQIDAVEVIGSVERFFIPEPTTVAEVLWQVGSTSPELAGLSFTTLGGMDASDTAVYVADAYNGVYVFDLEGNYQGHLAQGEIGYVMDVKVGPSNNVYLAEAGFQQVVMFDAESNLLGAFGGYGTGDGEFSGDSPATLAVDSDGSVYALDSGDAGTRVQVFTPEGDFIRTFPVEEALQARAMDIGPDDTLFLTGYGGYILELVPDDGRVIQRLGQEVLKDRFPQRLRVDDAGNFYVTTWGEYSAVKLDSQGQLLETIGVETVNDGVTGWPPGEFLFPVGIAVTGDGRHLFIGDGFAEFVFLTAYRYP